MREQFTAIVTSRTGTGFTTETRGKPFETYPEACRDIDRRAEAHGPTFIRAQIVKEFVR